VFRDGLFRRTFAAFKTSIKNDGWSTNTTGAPRGNSIPVQKGVNDRNPGTILDLVHNWGYFGSELREKLFDHATRQVTLNSAFEQLPHKENRVTLSKNVDALGLQRPLIQYHVDDDRGYVTQSFTRVIELHSRIFDALGVPAVDRYMQDDGIKTYGGSGQIMGTDSRTSVVDKNRRSHDHSNLYILGSGVFPTSSTANPTSTISALALRAVETIQRHLRS
jgi:choline dehydrogenase-like flavoprotein